MIYNVYTIYTIPITQQQGRWKSRKTFFCADDDENISSSRVDRPAEIGECIIQSQYDVNYYL